MSSRKDKGEELDQLDDSRGESPFGVGLGPMGPEEKNYLIKKGYLHEDSEGNLFGEPPTLIDESIAEANEERGEKESAGEREEVLFHVGDVSVRSVRFHMTSHSPTPSPAPRQGQGQGQTHPAPEGDGGHDGDGEEEMEFILSASALLSRHSVMKREDDFDENKENKENVNVEVGIGIEIEEVGLEELEEMEMSFSTPETSFCPKTPPHSELSDPQPAVDPEAEKDNSFYDSFESPLSHSHSRPRHQFRNRSQETESGEELDDTISEMERLLALADAQECEEEEKEKEKEKERLELERGQVEVEVEVEEVEELIPQPQPQEAEEEKGQEEFSPPLPTPPQRPEFKTPFAMKPRSGKKVVRPATPGSALPSSPGTGTRTNSRGSPSPRTPRTPLTPGRDSPKKVPSPSPRPIPPSSAKVNGNAVALCSTPKSTAKHCVTSMLQSPVSTIYGSPTPWGKGKGGSGGSGPGLVNKNLDFGKGIPIPTHVGTGIPCPSGSKTPLALALGGQRGTNRLLSGVNGGGGVSSPVARYIYSTPTPPMVKRAIKTECQSAPQGQGHGQEKRGIPVRSGLGLSSIPRAIPFPSSAIPRLGGLGGLRESGGVGVGRLTETGYNQRVNSMSMSRDGFGFGLKRMSMSEKQMKPIKYQGSSAQLSCPVRSVNQEFGTPGVPVSTPKVDVVKAQGRVQVQTQGELFIAQRHTGVRNTNTNESIVQHSSVDKKFVPTRVLLPPKN